MSTKRKTVVITGATAGVGRETVRVFARHGYDVALLARGDAGLRATAREVEELGQRCLVVKTDVADFAEVEAAAARVEDELGSIDVWVNNAMTTVFSPLENMRHDDFARAVNVTFLGQVWGTMVALDRMRVRDCGSIVNVGSALAFVGIPLQTAYCASKFACRGFFEAARSELLHDGSKIRLSMVHLPAMNTPQFDWCETTMDRHPQPVPPIYQPEIAAQAIFDSAVDGKRSRIVGSWNKMLVFMDGLFPGTGNHFASLGAWEGQLTKQKVRADRPSNLRAPADEVDDHGGHGIFDHRAGGVRDPSFLITLPKMAYMYVKSVALTLREAAEVRRRAEISHHHESAHDSSNEDDPFVGPDEPLGGHRVGETPQDVESETHQNNRSFTSPVTTEGSNTSSFDVSDKERDSLDVLEYEDNALVTLLDYVQDNAGPSVQERYAYGNLAKEILRHLAVREASLTDVTSVASTIPALQSLVSRMKARSSDRRRLYNSLTNLAHGVPSVDLNVGQDFSEPFERLTHLLREEIGWELSDAIVELRRSLRESQSERRLRSAHYVRRHASSHVSDDGPRWYENAPVVSRLLTMYERLNEFPRAARDWRTS